jgi:hypothetical protein
VDGGHRARGPRADHGGVVALHAVIVEPLRR